MSVGYNGGGGCSLNDLPDVLTVPDVQRVLRIGRNTVSELLRTGALKGFKIGSRWKIAKGALEAYIHRAERSGGEGDHQAT